MSVNGERDSSCIITAIGFVTQAGNKQQKYEILSRTEDSADDASLWSSGLLSRRTRYLCYASENINTCAAQKPVLVNLVLADDGDHIPANHQAVYNTIDTGERALKRKVLCAKFSPRYTAPRAITKVCVYSRPRTQAPGYSHVGEINSLQIYCKQTDIGLPNNSSERSSAQIKPMLPPVSSQSSTVPDANRLYPSLPLLPPTSNSVSAYEAFATTRRGTVYPLSGIPFELNKRFLADGSDEYRVSTTFFSRTKYIVISRIC
ncbi:Multivesicular body subunit 12B isoform 1 [Schistosoma japonicum]|uniref:Multivesicular body subunit 12B isoform 1 n=1 Tax=Schistosoma japonicum TaxID=6182 RepID=A0A4Z2CW98_SCHJA|nr:Multivesicular body subunit 12B [Schistosoma japonicum]TNN08511.1 Multivesicular body subunit 12B isoform 1 [Schistosoma japonicum]TNN08512.1 Multivesicular body subunit 12B isoform 1 [Schistosoma japonicum]